MAGEVFKVTNLTDHFAGKKVRGSQGLKWPKTQYGVVLLLGETPRSGTPRFDANAALNALGWYFKEDTDGNPLATAERAVTAMGAQAQESSPAIHRLPTTPEPQP